MIQDPAPAITSPIKSNENEPAAFSSPESAADSEARHYNPQLALTMPAKENTFGGKLKDAGSWMKDYGTALKHGSLKPFTSTERKTRAATRNQAWGPVGQELNELAALSYHPAECTTIFKVLELRLSYPPDKWRNVYKSLSVMEFLVKRGSEDAVTNSKGFINRLEYLESFAFITPDSRDVGGNIRHRARAIRALLQDEKRLTEERHAAAKQQSRMAGGNRVDEGRPGDSGGNSNKNVHGPSTAGDQSKEAISTTSPQSEATNTITASSLPNAGETKGVSSEANARHLTALKKILARPENALCADCGVPGAGHRPTWASISLGVFMCMRCAGVHRGLGVHVSQVRSCSLDSWLAPQIEFMASCGGNLRANQYWEARLPEGKKPPVATLADLDNFLRRKYTDKEFVDLVDQDSKDSVGGQGEVSKWPPSADEVEYSIMDAELKKILEEMLPENEREAAVKAREAAEAKAAAAREMKMMEEERETAERKAKEEAAEKAAESQVDLINLLDLDLGESSPAVSTVVATINLNNDTGRGDGGAGVDPFGALESIFIAPSTTAACEDKTRVVAQIPPATIDAWDMGAVLAAQQAQQAEEEAAKARKAAEDAAAAVAAEAAAAQQAAYRPPWAPSGSSPISSNGTAAGPLSPSPLGIVVPALLTGGPASAFENGFSGVPHQFTSTPVVPQGHVAHQYGWAQAPFSTNTNNTTSAARPVATPAPQRPLQPHELRAQQLLLHGLDSFNAHASLISVKQQSSPMNGLNAAANPGSIGGVYLPLKSPSPSLQQ
ncbi:hypothetical protein Ndes2526A_g01319 [Nannochloris sp. 'desiccata']|nr:hypothetical protein KSW81_004328 [Chlorella desiccata (nom. nud.)]